MRSALTTFLLLGLSTLYGCASKDQFGVQEAASPYGYQYQWEQGRIYHNRTGVEMTEQQLYDYLSGFSVVYVGESHDSVNDHAVQLKILKALVNRYPGQIALGMEMLRTDSQEGVDQWVAGELNEKEMMRLWADNWGGSSYPYYSDILQFVREEKIPLVALNRPKTNQPNGHGPEATGESSTAVATHSPPPEPEIDWNDPYYDAYIGAFLSGHGHELGPDMREKFMRGQLLWDETMAETGARYLAEAANHDKKLVIFAGGNHVRYGLGIPRRLFRRLPVNYAIVSPRVVSYTESSADKLMDVELPDLPMPESDITWFVGYEDLEDKRVKLGVSIAPAEESGVLVEEVYADSPAAEAGLSEGDIIRKLDGETVGDMFDLSYQLSSKVIGEKGSITIERDSKVITLDISFRNAAR